MSTLADIDWHPTPRKLRQFGWVAAAAFGLLALAAWREALMFAAGLGAARMPVTVALLAIGAAAGICSLWAPKLNRPLYLGLSLVSYPIGFVMSYVILGIVFFVVLAPIAVLFRILGRDALQRRFERETASYFSKAPPPRDKASYFRQF